MRKYRIWCENKKEWEKDSVYMAMDGSLFQIGAVSNVWVPLRPDSRIVEFWTGLLDKNGVEIYSGDILKCKIDGFPSHHIIEWSDKYCGWFARNTKAKHDRDGSIQLWVYAKHCGECKVIGNIHMNHSEIPNS